MQQVKIGRLTEVLRGELRRRKGEWPQIAKQSKGALTYRWIVSFAGEEVNGEPIITNVISLADALGLNIVCQLKGKK